MKTAIRWVSLRLLAIGLAGALHAQTLTGIGAAAPTPGANDISQLSTSGNQTAPDGLNYYTDNNSPPAQTFTTGSSAIKLKSVAIKTAGLNSGGGYGTPASTPNYHLRIYSISGGTATLLITFSAPNPGFTDGDWLKWSGINVPLEANKTYAFSFGIKPDNGGWAALAVAANAYVGGEIALIPINGGTITTGSSHSYDAAFSLGLQPIPSVPASVPLPTPTYGWNLGNTLEATWGVPSRSQKLFYTAANAGFNAVRIPCAWDFNSDPTTWQINASFMADVKQAVDWALACGMHVMINDHWDGGWLENNIGDTVDPVINAKMKSYWTQIATAFAGYDKRLLFGGANEPNVDSPAKMHTLMAYYQTFINAVRGVGGNNTDRWLVLQSVSSPSWMNYLPADPTVGRLMVEYHQYNPTLFTLFHTDQTWGTSRYFWGPAYHYSGNPDRNATWGEEGDIDAECQQLKEQYVDNGIPVLIGEMGAYANASLTGTEAAYNRASVLYWNKYVSESARAHGLSPFFWSIPGNLFDWNTGAVVDPEVVSVFTGGIAPPPPNGAPYAPSGLSATAAGTGQVNLSWAAGSGAISYNLYRSAQSGYEPAAPVVTGINGTSYSDTGLNDGTTYYYRVAAVNASGTSGFASEAHATTPGVNPDPARFHFETDPQRWQGGGGIISSVVTSTVQHYAGNRSLAVTFNGTSAGTSSVYVDGVVAAPGSTFTFRFWVPGGGQVTAVDPYMQDYNWTWASGSSGGLTANSWNTRTLTVPSTATTPFKQLGLRFTTNAAWTGTCYIDSVNWPVLGTPPPVPANLSASGGSGSVTLSWSASGTATYYVIKRSTTSGSGYTTIAINGALSFTDNDVVNGTTYYYVVSAVNDAGESANSMQSTATPLIQAPYSGAPWPVPGFIQAENYDIGGQGFAYNDSDTVNSGGQYRSDAVDVETCAEGGYNVGWIGAGEWLEYTVNVAYTGSYGITLRAASFSLPIQGHIEFDGVDATGLMTAPATGGWQAFTNVTDTNVTLAAGQHVMRVYFDGGAWNLSQVTITANPLPAPQNVTATPGASQIALSWDAVDGADGYTIQRSSNDGGPYTELVNAISATTYVDSSPSDDETWHYTIAAHGLAGPGEASAVVSATTYTAVESWRFTHFGTIENAAAAADGADPDGDAWTNEQEYISGTDPTDPSSMLHIAQMRAEGDDMVVTFPTESGRTYRLEASATLLEGSWETVAEEIPGTGEVIQVTDTGAASAARRFYRIMVSM
jgi:fibronectin type 3 domain-containing protein